MQKSFSAFLFTVTLFLIGTVFLPDKVNAQSGPNDANVGQFIYSGFSITAQPNKAIFKKRRMSIGAPTPVNVVGKEEIEQSFSSSIPEMTEIIRYTSAGVITNSQTTLNIRGVGNTRNTYVNNTLYGHNPNPRMVYSHTLVTNLDQIPIQSLEQIEVLRGPSNVLYGKNAVSGVINITEKKELEERNSGALFDPYYDRPTIDYSGLTNNLNSNWKAEVTASLSRGSYSITSLDSTYDPGGTMTYEQSLNDDFVIAITKYLDSKNNLRQVTDTEIYPENYASTEIKYYNCDGKVDFSTYGYTDQNGYEHNLMNTRYNNGKPTVGSFIPDDYCDASLQQYYQEASKAFRSNTDIFNFNSTGPGPGAGTDDPYGLHNIKLPFTYTDLACSDTLNPISDADYEKNIITIGPNIRLEDFGGDRKTFFGGNVTYTRFLKPWVGLTADVGFNFGTVNNTNLTVGSYFGGPTFVPFKSHGIDDKVTISAHTLAGYTGVTSKTGGNSNSNGNFSLKLGVRADLNFTRKLGIYLGADDNMVLGKGFTSNNFTFGLGLRLGFK